MKFQEWEQSIDKQSIEELIIPNHLEFENDKLVIKNYSKLKVLNANSCNLKEIDINCPSLEYLWLNDNKLEKVDLNQLPNLRTLIISNNNLRNLKVKHLSNLKTLWCFKNKLERLDCSDLDKLEDLNCSHNIKKIFLSCKKPLEFKKGLEELKLDGCVNLESIDTAENSLEDLTFPHLPKLRDLSLRENNSLWIIGYIIKNKKSVRFSFKDPEDNKKLIINSPNLEFLDCAESNIKEVEFIQPCPYSRKDDGYESDKEKNQSADAPTEWEQRAYERQQRKEKEDINNRRGVYEGMLELDFSHKNYTKMNLDGIIYPKSITSINLGNNKLKWLRVANFPNLQRLITSHNKLIEENVIIENCPNLDKENLFYNHKSFDENVEEPTEEKEYNPEEIDDSDIEVNLLTQQIEEIFARNEEDIEFDELQQLLNEIDLSLIDSNYGKKLLALYHKKFQEKFPQLFKNKPQDQENKPDFEKFYNELLEKIEKGKITKKGAKDLIKKSSFSGGNSSDDEEKKRTLTKMIEDYYANKEASSPQPTTIATLWISLGKVAIILVLIGYFLTMLRNENKKTIDKKPKKHA